MSEKFDVVVIGGGTAGLVTASGCARLGRRVALVEREKLGGDCLWTGCVPTKALVASAKLLHQMHHAGEWGLPRHEPKIDPAAIMRSMREAIRITSHHDDPQKFRNLGIDVIEGEAKLIGKLEVQVGSRTLAARDIVLATGSRTSVPPVDGLTDAGFLDHRSFLDRDTFPASLLILGGGAIGIEFAQIFRRFGCEVTVVEMAKTILVKEDAAVAARIHDILASEGITIHTGWAVKSVTVENVRKVAHIESERGDRKQVAVEEIFVASGRRGNIEGLGLEEAGVRTERNFVVADKYLQTTSPRVWACGDIHGGMQFTHVAAYEAVKIVRNMLFPGKSPLDYNHIPWGLYTDPEVGHIGLTEAEAKEQYGDDSVRTYQVEMSEVDRAVVDRTTRGFIKFVCDTKGNILGGHAVCANASTVIEEIVLARKKGVKLGELAQMVSPYPSLADAIQKTAALYYENLGTSWLGMLGKRIASWSQ
jgi:pyruvate/2-oxoglutarate dehydrogenase complex dihydrolipoamide dehydrogenase (E3) component